MIRYFHSINHWLDRLLFWATAVCSMAFFIMVIGSVLSRYVFQTPILASIELSRLFFVWACFLAAAMTYYRNAHIRLTFLSQKWTVQTQQWMNRVIYSLIFMFLLGILYYSIQIICLIWQTDFPMLRISQGWLYMPLPVVCIFMLMFSLEYMITPPVLDEEGEG